MFGSLLEYPRGKSIDIGSTRVPTSSAQTAVNAVKRNPRSRSHRRLRHVFTFPAMAMANSRSCFLR
ncbi:unnamed protein product [Brassica oleracea var. botrytis]|uniref:Uncharacterized protein n=1 Tax=Brassica oleracea TaxID=3712 RepID=A0A3P6EN61_BRAOL|nr:unnamed protein product [Brassica oleracea]